MSTYTRGLNPEQSEAVETIDGPLLVLAGAGTGKTRVITHRMAHMISHGISPTNILAMTFTNKAAGEMRERLGKLVGKKQAEVITAGTFHSFCVKSLRRFGDRIGIRKNFGICDADDQLVAMKQALRELQIPETQIQPRHCLARVSLLKNRLVDAEAAVRGADDWEADIARAYTRYDAALRASGLLDFDDLLTYMVKLLEAPKVRAAFQKQYGYILVDEYQDTNGPQYEIVRRIAEKHQNVCVVGDDDQSIYGWRGADISKILNFEQDFPNAKVIRLETNYRSTVQILSGANAVISNNPSRHEKRLRSALGKGEPIVVRKLRDEEAEAAFVVEDLIKRARETGQALGTFAILFRTQVQPRLFELQLRQNHVPYNLVGGMSFFDRKEVKDILAYLRLVANPSDELSLLRVINKPPRGIGATTIEKALVAAAREKKPLAEVIIHGNGTSGIALAARESARRFLDGLTSLQNLSEGHQLVDLIKQMLLHVDYAEEMKRTYPDAAGRSKRWEGINEIMNMAEIYGRRGDGADLSGFLEDVTLAATDDDDTETAPDRVTLMTLHSAKGLEFGEVYLVGMEEGILPHLRSLQDGGLEEERRLAYVGITRAQRRLTISYTASRARYGDRVTSVPSRFLYEMHGKTAPEAVLTHTTTPAKPPDAKQKKRRKGSGASKKAGR